MIRSHYIPQFILRSFCEDNQITYCDLDKKSVERRNPRSTFAEIGYYPETIEKSLCVNIEHEFANLFHNKLEKLNNKIILTPDELFVLKKYLLIASIRYRFEMTDDEKTVVEALGDAYKPDFIGSLNTILGYKSIEDVSEHLKRFKVPQNLEDARKMIKNPDVNVPLYIKLKHVMQTYIIFVRAQGSEEFLIPDIGNGLYIGPYSLKKYEYMFSMSQVMPHPFMIETTMQMTPYDYSVFPLSKKLAVLCMSGFYKIIAESILGTHSTIEPGIDSMLGFGTLETFTGPKIKKVADSKEYHYQVKRIQPDDVAHLNSEMLSQAEHHMAVSNLVHLRKTLKRNYGNVGRDYSFLEGNT